MKNKANAAIKRFDMLKANDRVVVGVSGGADSMALLHFLRFNSNLSLKITVCHINHFLRGEESDSDERFVKDMCEKWGVEFNCLRCDVAAKSRAAGQSVEEYARKVRYDFFNEYAKDGKIATAHTLSDAAETLLFNLARGSSVSGLCSIPPVRDNIIRPLILATRSSVEEYCAKNGIDFVTDSTNLTDDYSRNKIRHSVVPVLKEINPKFEQAAERFINSAMADEAHFSKRVSESLDAARIFTGDKTDTRYNARVLASLDRAVMTRCAKEIIKGANVTPNGKNIDSLCGILRKCAGRTGLSGKIRAEIRGGILHIESEQMQEYFEYTLCLSENSVIITDCEGRRCNSDGGIKIGEKSLVVSVVGENKYELLNNIHKKALFLRLDCDKISSNLIIRQRRDGDSIKVRSMTRTVKKLFNEKKMSAYEKSICPIVEDSSGTVGVVGFFADDRAAVTKRTKTALVIELI